MRWVRLWRTRNPATFTEKVRYKMLRDRRPLVVTFADKAAVRGHVAAVVGERYLPRLHHLIEDPAELAHVELPASYVVKPTHGSGVALLVSDGAPADARLPEPRWGWVYRHVRPEHAHREVLVALGRSWASQLYGQGPNREWAYGHVPRRVLVEELLTGADGGVPDDYKLFVFHGVCHYVEVDRGRFGDRTQDFLTRDWVHLPVGGGHPWAEPTPSRPDRWAEMVEVAERLGAATDFVRVDLYVTGDRVVVGELTSYPAGGDSPFEPPEWDRTFGRPWTVPRRYR